MQRKLVKPLLKFKVWVRLRHDKDTPFYWCSIWRTLPDMRNHMRDINAFVSGGALRRNTSWKHALASCYSWSNYETEVIRNQPRPGMVTVRSSDKLKPEMGIIVLAIAYTGSNTVAHECCHAAFGYVSRFEHESKRKKGQKYHEELFCTVVGEMCQQIIRKLVAYDKRKK